MVQAMVQVFLFKKYWHDVYYSPGTVQLYNLQLLNNPATPWELGTIIRNWGTESLSNLRVPWTEMKSNPSILKEINPEYLLERLMLKLQYFGHLMWRANSLEKTLMLGKIEGRRRRGRQRMRWLNGITDPEQSREESEGKPGVLQSMGSQRLMQLSDSTRTTTKPCTKSHS